jgi:eukaryotic-like serine/threonine-protein kinase
VPPSDGEGIRPPATETYVDLMERLPPGARVANRYVIVAIAGVGGMGVVYRARDEELRVDVALKVLRQDLGASPRALERFRAELLAARQVTHKNAVRLHDIGEDAGLRFLTMDYVEGRSLREILEKEGPLPLERASAIVRQVAEALGAAHEKGIVHRDLKPGNILIDSAGTAFITDFGVALSLQGQGLTRPGAIIGTPDYLSPEQVSGDPVDGRADLYALGIVFYEMLSGELPFAGGSQSEILAQRLAGRPRDLKETGVRAPAWVGAILRRCLERSPARRYPDARALLADLDRRQSSRPKRRVGKALFALVAVLVLAAAVWTAVRSRAGLPLVPGRTAEVVAPAAPKHAVAVLPFADETRQPSLAWAAPGIAEMLAANLAESPNLRVLDSLRVMRGVRDLRVAEGSMDEAGARQLAELWSVDTLVTGTVRRAGEKVRVDLSIQQVGPGGVISGQAFNAEGNGEGDIFRLVAGLGGELRRRLGTSPAPGEAAAIAGTASVEAEKAYEEGKVLLARGNEIEAAPAFERAVAADPRFAAALEKLAETYQGLGYQEKAVGAAERALAAAGKAGSRVAFRARARLALLRGDPADAEKSYRELLRKFPNDTEPQLDLAVAQASRGHNTDAVATLKRVVAVDPNEPRAWLLLGRNTVLMGDGSRAIRDYLVRALALQTQLGNEKGKADTLAAIAKAYQRSNDYPRALENSTAALQIQKSLGDERGLASSLRDRALIYQAMGKLADAQEDLKAARALYEKIGDGAGVADAWNASGVIEEARGAYGKAFEAYQSALKLRRTLGDERLLAQSYDNIGYIYYLQGEYDNGLVYWQQALDLRRKIQEKSGVVLSLQNLGFLALAQGRWDEATRLFAEALETSRETGQKDAAVISLGNLGLVHQLRGQFSAALSSLDEALALARALPFEAASVEFTLKKAAIALELGRAEDAGALLADAEKRVGGTGNSEQQADLEVLRGGWCLFRGDRDGARKAFDRALPLARESGSRVSQLRARLARAAAFPGALGEGPAPLAAVLADAESLGHTVLTLEASEALARNDLARRRFAAAAQTLRKAVALAERAGWNEGLYRLYALSGNALDGSGDRAAAADAFGKAAAEIAKLRENVPAAMRASFENLPTVRDVLARGSGSR